MKRFLRVIARICIFLSLLIPVALSGVFPEKEQFHFVRDEPIDVVIPCCGKDLVTLEMCIDGVKKYVKGVRRIVIVSPTRYTSSAEWYSEKSFPFDKASISREIFSKPKQAKHFLESPKSRAGWIYQQLLKLYAPYVIPGMSGNVLVVDADLIFLNPVSFTDDSGSGLYSFGTEYYRPYFFHMERLLPGLSKLFANRSGIAHHMLFQRPVLDSLFHDVQQRHGEEFWKAFCHCINESEVWGSCASEYEIYFNYVFKVCGQTKIRELKWANIESLRGLSYYQREGYHFVANHSYQRKGMPDEYIPSLKGGPFTAEEVLKLLEQ